MADHLEIDFIAECEQRLRCQYIRPDFAGPPLPAPNRLTRYLLPASLDALGVFAPNAVVELLLVANITPRTFWGEVEEAFADAPAGLKVSIVKSKASPLSSLSDVPHSSSGKRATATIEVRGRVISLEYCQVQRVEEFLDSSGRIMQDLTSRASLIQETATGDMCELLSTNATSNLKWAHNGGLLSKRLGLLTPEMVFQLSSRSEDEPSDPNSFHQLLCDEFATIRPLAMRKPVPQEITSNAPKSPADWLETFRKTHSQFVLVQLNCWAPGMRLLLADAFFDVVAAVQKHIHDSAKHGARVWPFYLTGGTSEEGAANFLIGTWNNEGNPSGLDEVATTDRVFQLAAEILGKQYGIREDGHGDECSIQAHLIGREHEFFADLRNYSQRHVSPVRGLTSAALLPKPEGDASLQISDDSEQLTQSLKDPTNDDAATSSTTFRTAKKILDQLRWDPKYAGSRDYEVGYEDRFSDALLWLPIEQWVQTTEEEEFIPLHRIRQYRNITTKEIIWDRAMRVDKLK